MSQQILMVKNGLLHLLGCSVCLIYKDASLLAIHQAIMIIVRLPILETKHALSQGEMPSHTHLVQDYYGVESSKTAGEYKNKNKLYGGYKLLDSTYYGIKNGDEDNDSMLYSTHNTGFEGNGDAHENRPPYYVLAYIMRAK